MALQVRVDRSLAATGLAALILSLAACSPWSESGDTSSRLLSSRVIEHPSAGDSTARWSFQDSLGHSIPLSRNCGSGEDSLCWSSEDGRLSFGREQSIHGPSSYRLTVDGTTVRLGCATDHWASGGRVCAAFPEQSQGFSSDG